LDLSVLADSIRLKNKIDEMDLSEDLVESFIENINIHCFKRGMKAEEFINIINKVSFLSEKLGMPLDQLPNYLIQKELEVEKMNGEIKDVKMKKHLVLLNYGITMNDLDEYKSNKPLIDYIKQLKTQLEEAKQNIINLVKKLSDEQLENAKWLQKWRMLP
jgi:hypothetical protein